MEEPLGGCLGTSFSTRHRVVFLNPADDLEAELLAHSGLGKERVVDPTRGRHVISS
jgi:hypothetical protein